MARLQRSLRELAHQRCCGGGQGLDRLVPVRQLEQFQRQRIAIVLLGDIAAPTKRVDHTE
jgi:hypothetical protein